MLIELYIDLQSKDALTDSTKLAEAVESLDREFNLKLIYKPYKFAALFDVINFDKYAFCLLKLASYDKKGFKFIRLYKSIDSYSKDVLIDLALTLNLDFDEVDQALNTNCLLNDLDLDIQDALSLGIDANSLVIEKQRLNLGQMTKEEVAEFISNIYLSRPRDVKQKQKGEFCASCCTNKKN